MLKILLTFLISCSFVFGGLLKDDIKPIMQEKIDYVIEILKEENIDKKSLSNDIFEQFNGLFDFSLMARLSLGSKQWNNLNKDEKEYFTSHFIDRMKRSFTERLELYSDEIMVIKDTKEVAVGRATRVYLVTELIGKEKNYPIVYKFHNSKKDNWIIYDVDILDVSLIQTYRSQFDGYLEKNSLGDLIAWLSGDEAL